MKKIRKIFDNLYYKWGAIREILLCDFFVQVSNRTTKKGDIRRIATNLIDHESIIFILDDTAKQLEQAGQSTESLLNILGIKREEE